MPSKMRRLVLAIVTTSLFIGHSPKSPAQDQRADQPSKAEVDAAKQAAVARQAEANYRQAKLTREVAEYALKEYVQGLLLQAKAQADAVIPAESAAGPQSDMPIVRWKKDPGSHRAELRVEIDSRPELSIDNTMRALWIDIVKARADEAFKEAIYQRERAKGSDALRPALR